MGAEEIRTHDSSVPSRLLSGSRLERGGSCRCPFLSSCFQKGSGIAELAVSLRSSRSDGGLQPPLASLKVVSSVLLSLLIRSSFFLRLSQRSGVLPLRLRRLLVWCLASADLARQKASRPKNQPAGGRCLVRANTGRGLKTAMDFCSGGFFGKEGLLLPLFSFLVFSFMKILLITRTSGRGSLLSLLRTPHPPPPPPAPPPRLGSVCLAVWGVPECSEINAST